MIQMSPVAGCEIPLAKVPGGVSTVSSTDISQISTTDALQTYVPSVTTLAASLHRRLTASHRAWRSIRTGCASTKPLATRSISTSFQHKPSTASQC
jgi:hypothetical protein